MDRLSDPARSSANVRLSLALSAAGVALLLLAAPAQAVHGLDIIELDGSIADATPAAAPYDWTSLFGCGSAAPPICTPVEPAAMAGITVELARFAKDHEAPGPGSGGSAANGDSTTHGSNKDIHNINGNSNVNDNWQCNRDNNVLNKNDILNSYALLAVKNNRLYLYLGLERDTSEGQAFAGFWIFQDAVGCVATGGGSSAFSGQHTFGDLLVIGDFTGGGSNPIVRLYRWNPAAPSNLEFLGTGLSCAGVPPGDLACGSFNTAEFTTPWPPRTGTTTDGTSIGGTIPANGFYEAGIDLTHFLNLPAANLPGGVPCFGTFMASTRSSIELTADLKDFVTAPFSTCVPELTIDKTSSDSTVAVGDGFDWEITIENVGTGNAVSASFNDTIPSGLTIGSSIVVTPAGPSPCTVVGQAITCPLGTLEPGDVVTITIPVTATSGACGIVTNTGTVRATDLLPVHDQASVDVECARILVNKVTDPTGSTVEFDFDANWTASGFSLADGDQHDSGAIPPGTYSLEEDVPSGWALDDVQCTRNGASESLDLGNITLADGDEIECTFYNTQQAKIIVVKEVDPSTDTSVFDFDSSWGTFSLGHLDEEDSGWLTPGTGYWVEEDDYSPEWTTTSECDNGDDVDDITLNPGDVVTCTFTNTKQGRVFVLKATLPSSDDETEFGFNATWGAGGTTFNLTNFFQTLDHHDSGLLAPANYSVEEDDIPAGWENTFSACGDHDDFLASGTDPSWPDVKAWLEANGFSPADFALSAGQEIFCAFENTQQAKIIVVKEVAPTTNTDAFDFDSSWGTFSLGHEDEEDSGYLAPGTGYWVEEDDYAPEWVTTSECDNGDDVDDITLNPGDVVTCTFTNTQQAKIIVVKEVVPTTDTTEFDFTSSWGDPFSLGHEDEEDSGYLAPDTGYWVEEDDYSSAWDTESECDNGDDPSDITLNPGDVVTCTFTNSKRPWVQVVKTKDSTTGVVDPGKTFQIRQGADGNNLGTTLATGVTNATGETDFGGVTFAPGTYQLCETLMAGWDVTFVGYGPKFVPGLVADPTLDNSVWCVDIVLAYGDDPLVVQAVNVYQGGSARTIGYWRNWSSCSGGKQGHDLDRRLGETTYTLGNLVLGGAAEYDAASETHEDCEEARNLLMKRHIYNGRNKANDAAYALAAQMLATRLNLAASVPAPPCVTDGLVTANGLLSAIYKANGVSTHAFDGTGDYLGPKVKHANQVAQRQQAHELAALFDAFNNNTLVCP